MLHRRHRTLDSRPSAHSQKLLDVMHMRLLPRADWRGHSLSSLGLKWPQRKANCQTATDTLKVFLFALLLHFLVLWSQSSPFSMLTFCFKSLWLKMENVI